MPEVALRGDSLGLPWNGNRLWHSGTYETRAQFRTYLFGGPRLFRDGELVRDETRRRKAALVVAWFILNPDKLASADELVDSFWPESNLEAATRSFHVTMHYVRRIFEPGLQARQPSTFIVRHQGPLYQYRPTDQCWADTDEVDILFRRAQALDVQGDARRACFHYGRIAQFCSLGLLPEEEACNWLAPHRMRYRQIHLQALMRLISYFEQRGDEEELVQYAYEMVGMDEVNEAANCAIIDALLRTGNVNAARDRLSVVDDLAQRDFGFQPAWVRATAQRVFS